MDKLDKLIKQAAHDYKPSEKFVINTMSIINERKPHTRGKFSFKLLIPAFSALAIIGVLLLAGPFSNRTTNNNSASPSSSQKANLGGASTGSDKSKSINLPQGTSNSDLSSDLDSINSSINQENTDQASANSGINDASQEINIPTN